MSEGIQEKKARKQQKTGSKRDTREEGNATLFSNQHRSFTPGSRASEGQSGRLVAVYDELIQRQPVRGGFSPDQIVVKYITHQIDLIQANNDTVSERAALTLLQTLKPIFNSQSPEEVLFEKPLWKIDLVEKLIHILQTNSTYKAKTQYEKNAKEIVRKLEVYFKPTTTTATTATATPIAISPTATPVTMDSKSDPSMGIINVLASVGPECTWNISTLRDTLKEIMSSLSGNSNATLDEASVARIIYFFSDKAKRSSDGELEENTSGSGGWNLRVVSRVLSEDYTALDWKKVVAMWDFADFNLRDVEQIRTLLELYRAGAKQDPPLSALTSEWRNQSSQCSLMESMLAAPPSVYACPMNEDESRDAATVGMEGQQSSSPNPQFWASSDVLQRLLYLSDVQVLARRIRDLFVKGLLSCPEVLLCALVRLQLNVANAAAQGGADSLPNAGMQMKGELMRELIPLFFKPNPHHRVSNGPAALRRLWAISPNTVTAACIEAWRSTVSEAPPVRLATVVHIISIIRLLPSPEHAIASLLNGSKDQEFSIAVAFVMADNDILQLKPWLTERIASTTGGLTAGALFAMTLTAYLGKMYQTATPRAGANNNDSSAAPLVSLENVAISLQVLHGLDSALLSQTIPSSDTGSSGGVTLRETVKRVSDACFTAHPSLRGNVGQPPADAPASNGSSTSSGSADDIEEMANSYFQKIYTSEQSIGEVVEMLKRFKASGDSRENDIFACMIHNLFDEYRFFSKYPEKELRITGILFGTLIQQQLVSSITLGIALRYVLEALRKPPSPPGSTTSSSGKMFRFGMFALEQFKSRLHEWPQYCSHIVQIPHLKDGYADLVAEIESAMAESQNRTATPSATASSSSSVEGSSGAASLSASSVDNDGHKGQVTFALGGQQSGQTSSLSPGSGSLSTAALSKATTIQTSNLGGLALPSSLELKAPTAPVKPRVAVFGPNLGRAVNGQPDDTNHESPPDAVLDRVQFLINNVSPSNVDQKTQELKDMLEPTYFGWLGHYLVVKRISTQPNFHSLYLAFLDQLGDYGKGLVEAIIASVYLNVGKLLRSPKITTSTSERSLLKNLGSWLGQITLARNRPILQIMLDCKELLFQGYENGMLIAVTPFVAKILEGAKNSIVFRPPNPWLMGLLSVFKALYSVEDLKMNIKFEVEVLCKNLGVKLEEIPLRNNDLAKRIPPIKEKNPDFNMKSSMVGQSSSSSGGAAPVSGGLPGSDAKLGSGVAQSAGILGAGALGTGSATASQDQQTVIPNLAAYVTINPSLTQLIQQSQSGIISSTLNSTTLKRSVPVAVDRAIREIIQPVVERSVSIACITTKEIVTKDFAMESDENKMRKAAQLMVANLAGSLSLVTCREPLRASVSTHLRQLLTSTVTSSEKLSDQEQNVVEQCVAICATDNLELGCMLIEKAATEKAVRDMDEALAPALSARRKHREQTGQPFYDMSIFGNGNQRYPGSLPEPLQPKPGGLRSEQLRVYEAFHKMSRQAPGVLSAQAGIGTSAAQAPVGGASLSSVAKTGTGQQFNLDVLSAIAGKMDNVVTTLLSQAGPRAPEITLSMLPAEHEVRQLLSAVQRAFSSNPLASSEKESVLAFSQSIFKRLYELSLSEPLRLEALVALMEKINEYCPQLGKDIGTWARYAPTETEMQRKLHRTVLLLLVRSGLIPVTELDVFLSASADNGRNPIWVEFSLLFIRTAFLERLASPSDFPKLMDLMTAVAEGRSQASPQVSQPLRKPILRMLEELRSSQGTSASQKTQQDLSLKEGTSLSSTSLKNLLQATANAAERCDMFARNDPPNAKQQVTFLLDNWIRVHNEATSNEKILAQYFQLLQQHGVGKIEEQTERFLRLATSVVVEAVLKSSGGGDGSTKGKVLNYNVIDVYAKLVFVLVRYMNGGGTSEQVATQRVALLNKIFGVTVRCLLRDYERSKKNGTPYWDQRPWYRLLLNFVIDLNTPNPALDSISFSILSTLGAAFHVLQPLVVPGFAFAWLDLVSHQKFMPNLLQVNGQKGWNLAHQLLMDLFLFLEPHLKRVELTPPIKKLYEGTLRLLLELLHDHPSFLAAYYASLCNVIPENCVQLRNLILSAVPRGMVLPDPFTPNLKIDLLPEISKSPLILSNVLGPLDDFRPDLDSFLKDRQRSDFVSGLLPRLYKSGSAELDVAKINSLVIYVGIQAIARLQNSQISHTLAHTPEMEILQKLMEFDDKGRYISLNAIANQLRYPSSHTHYFSCVTLYLFGEAENVAVKEQITRVLLERLILHRPHPWGLLITFIELIKNQRYQFWSLPFTRCANEIEKVFESVARSCMPPGTTAVGGEGDLQ